MESGWSLKVSQADVWKRLKFKPEIESEWSLKLSQINLIWARLEPETESEWSLKVSQISLKLSQIRTLNSVRLEHESESG